MFSHRLATAMCATKLVSDANQCVLTLFGIRYGMRFVFARTLEETVTKHIICDFLKRVRTRDLEPCFSKYPGKVDKANDGNSEQ